MRLFKPQAVLAGWIAVLVLVHLAVLATASDQQCAAQPAGDKQKQQQAPNAKNAVSVVLSKADCKLADLGGGDVCGMGCEQSTRNMRSSCVSCSACSAGAVLSLVPVMWAVEEAAHLGTCSTEVYQS